MSENNMRIYGQVQNTPQEARKTIPGGRLKGFTDINPMWRIKKLTEVFGPAGLGWYYKITEKRLEQSGDEVAAFVDIELYVKDGDEWSMPIVGTGGASFVAKEKYGLYVSDECFKMALTDALGIACKALGFSSDIYFEKDRSKYDVQSEIAEGNKNAKPPKQEKPKSNSKADQKPVQQQESLPETTKPESIADKLVKLMMEYQQCNSDKAAQMLFATYKRDTGKTISVVNMIQREWKEKYLSDLEMLIEQKKSK